MSKVISKPQIGSRWIAKIGDHVGLQVTVVKVGGNTVSLKQSNTSRIRVNGSSSRGALLRLPIDAFYRRYARA